MDGVFQHLYWNEKRRDSCQAPHGRTSAPLCNLRKRMMSIPGILNPVPVREIERPADEEILDDSGDIMSAVVDRHTEAEEADSEDEREEEPRKVTTKTALESFENVMLWVMQQEDGEQSQVAGLRKLETSNYETNGLQGCNATTYR